MLCGTAIRSFIIDVAIGFDSTSYTVNESEGTVLIRLEVDLQENVIFENTSIQVVLATTAGSATSRGK